MRLVLDPRARRLLRRVPHTTVYSAMELLLLSLLAVQCARLVWAAVTPVGPVGEWRSAAALRALPAVSSDLLGSFDPFFRLSGDNGAVTVTSLDLKLYGVREDRASGRGSAIIGTPTGQQRSFVIGEEIMPGVVLTGVAFDGVTISRAGATEQIYLDQSTPAQTVTPEQPEVEAPDAAPPAEPTENGAAENER